MPTRNTRSTLWAATYEAASGRRVVSAQYIVLPICGAHLRGGRSGARNILGIIDRSFTVNCVSHTFMVRVGSLGDVVLVEVIESVPSSLGSSWRCMMALWLTSEWISVSIDKGLALEGRLRDGISSASTTDVLTAAVASRWEEEVEASSAGLGDSESDMSPKCPGSK